jgi:hypothetical protein
MMASDDKKIKTNSAPENEAPPEKPVSKAYRDNWNVIFAKKKKR